MNNDHLATLQPGQDAVINLDATGVRGLKGGSDYLPPGKYMGYISDLEFPKKQDGTGHYTAMTIKVLAPEEYAGRKVSRNGAAPFGEKAQAGVEQLVKLDKSICSFGNVEEPQGAFQRSVDTLKNRQMGFVTADENYEGKTRTRVHFFVNKDEFEATPGPFDKNHPGVPPDAGMMPVSAPPAPVGSVVGGVPPIIAGAQPVIAGATPATVGVSPPQPQPASPPAPIAAPPVMGIPAASQPMPTPPAAGVAVLAGVPAGAVGGNTQP